MERLLLTGCCGLGPSTEATPGPQCFHRDLLKELVELKKLVVGVRRPRSREGRMTCPRSHINPGLFPPERGTSRSPSEAFCGLPSLPVAPGNQSSSYDHLLLGPGRPVSRQTDTGALQGPHSWAHRGSASSPTSVLPRD